MIDPRFLTPSQQRDAIIIGIQIIAACNYLTQNPKHCLGTFAIDGMNPQDGMTSFAVLITNKPNLVQAIKEDQTDAAEGRGFSAAEDTRLWQLLADAVGVNDLQEAPARGLLVDPPLVAGGQGRSDEDTTFSRQGLLAVIGLLGAIIVSGAVYAAVYWLVH